jgi:hypothetical protein
VHPVISKWIPATQYATAAGVPWNPNTIGAFRNAATVA